MTSDAEFDRVIRAYAHYLNRPRVSPEERKRLEAEAHKKDPKHIKALKKRRKAKRGGPR